MTAIIVCCLYGFRASTKAHLAARAQNALGQGRGRLRGGLAHTTVAIVAIGGMGKTALARQFCLNNEVWQSYDLVLGAQARKRQIGLSTRRPRGRVIHFEEQGKELNLQEFLIEIARQLHVSKPDLKTVSDLENDIAFGMKGRSALIVLDNLETAGDTAEILLLLDRICVPPSHKALITTRHYPSDYPQSFYPLELNIIQDVDCRHLIEDLLQENLPKTPAADEAIDAIIEISRGHPLSLKLLTGKLVTQGINSIIGLRKNWRAGAVGLLDDEFFSALCEYVFNDQFMEHIGSAGVDMLSAIAVSEAGQDEDKLRQNIDLPDDMFNETLDRLFHVNCIQRELDDQYSVLTMHSITRAFFRAKLL
jgi:NB-ARC domain